MRERLVLAFVGLTLAVIGLYGVPRAYFLADLVRDDERASLTASADVLEALVAERTAHDGTVDAGLLSTGLGAADWVLLERPDGSRTVAGSGSDDAEGGVSVTRTLDDGSTLQLATTGHTTGSSIRSALLPLVLLGLLLAVLSALLGLVLARRMSRPFRELAAYSRELGHGRFDIDVPSYAVPEAEAIGASLRGAATRLDDLVRRERELAVNASHELRTPITALRLGLEDLALWPETAPEVRAELEHGLTELDRLTHAVDELLALAHGRRLDTQQDVDLGALARAHADRWSDQLEADGRTLTVDAPDAVRTRVPAGAVEQVLDVLIDNALVHGRGTITVAVRDSGTHLEFGVADEGTARLRPDVFRRGSSDGIGLAVASELAELCGGHLSLDAAAPSTRFVLWLPRVS